MPLNSDKNKIVLSNPPAQPQLLSVIIPAYNARDTLGEQLEALRNQTYEGKWEIIVVDNNSSDGTAELVQTYQHTMPHLRLVPAPNKRHVSYARNVGANAARGEALLFCDADDVVAPGWVAALALALSEHHIVSGFLDRNALNQDIGWQPVSTPDWALKAKLDFLPFAVTSNMAVSKEAFALTGGFSEDFFSCGEDVDFSWRLQLLCGVTIHYAPDAIVCYRLRSSLWANWTRMVQYAEAHVVLYKRFSGYGMPRSSVRKAWRRYKKLIKTLPYLWNDNYPERANWLRKAAVSWGRLRGSLRYRTLYL